jgi:hypothetical protein
MEHKDQKRVLRCDVQWKDACDSRWKKGDLIQEIIA